MTIKPLTEHDTYQPVIKSGLRIAILTCALAAAATGVSDAATFGNVPPEVGLRAIESTYHQLVDELEQSRSAGPNSAIRLRIIRAAQEFQSAISRDGGARSNLSTDAKNIVISLRDGTFNADASIDALRRDSKDNLVDIAIRKPSSLEGSLISGPIGTHLNQRNEGDCVGISVLKAFSNTPTGAAILRRVVTGNADGSYNVRLTADPSTTYHLGPNELDQYGKGDPSAAAIVGAMFRYFHLDPQKGSLPTNKVMELLAGNLGKHARLADAETTPKGITDFLIRNADGVGSRVAMVFGGRPGRNGDWSKGDGHAFAVIHIDVSSGMLTYTNPWNEATPRKIAIADLAQQAAGTSADFETVTFR